MKDIHCQEIISTVKRLFIEANTELGQDMLDAFKSALAKEESPVGQDILNQLMENARLAKETKVPICQDTGLAVVFVELGQDVHVVGGGLKDAIEEGVRQGYREGYLRKSACHPFTRKNTGDNTPAVIYIDVVPGEQVKIIAVPKGGGSENMSRIYMLSPAMGIKGVKEKVLETVREAGPNPCPPTIIGVGIGGTFEQAALQAKKALLRPVGEPNPDPEIDRLEREWLEEINRLGIGPQGLGGRITSLSVHIHILPCHIASLPVAINVQCHANRHKVAVL
nr:fumarate hydratase [Desulfobacterales bacterium]